MPFIETQNDGRLILASTYWGSEIERAGKVWCSVNAGAIRVLVPRQHREMIGDMRAASHCILSRGPWPGMADDAIELLWDDGSDHPFALHLTPASFDLLPAEPPTDRDWVISVWDVIDDRPHEVVKHTCHWRRVERIPCLQPWKPTG